MTSTQLDISNPKIKEESTPNGKLHIWENAFEVRDLYKRINAKLCWVVSWDKNMIQNSIETIMERIIRLS